MSGIFPNPAQGGIAPGIAVPPGYDPTNDPIGTLALYFSQNCGVRLTPEVLNAIISQIAAAIDVVGLAYDPAKGGVDLAEAIQYYVQKNMGAYVELQDGPAHYTALGSPTFFEYKEGMVVWGKMPGGANNVAGADLSVDGLPYLPIVRPDGSAVVSNDLLAGRGVGLILINNQWQMFTTASDFMTLARQRLPFFPDIQTVTGRMGVVSPGTGSVVIPNGVAFLHRGIFLDNTDNYSAPQKTFATVANKTYHLRWTPFGGFALRDLADGTYNPTVALEESTLFDTTYDDMLIARVVTNGANVATVTDLANKVHLSANFLTTGAPTVTSPGSRTYQYTGIGTLGWGRSPRMTSFDGQITGNGARLEGYAGWILSRGWTRYMISGVVSQDWFDGDPAPINLTGYMNMAAYS